ncbi:hypothetical protein IFM89_033090, partial [Coptis chinensis]
METQKDVVTQPNVDINRARVRKKIRTNTESSVRSEQGSFELQTRPQAVIGAQISGALINHPPTTQVQPHRQLPMSIVTLEPSRRSVSLRARRDTARVMSSPKAQSSQSSSYSNNHSPPAVLPTQKASAHRALISSPKAHSGQSSSDLNNRSTPAVLPTRKALAQRARRAREKMENLFASTLTTMGHVASEAADDSHSPLQPCVLKDKGKRIVRDLAPTPLYTTVTYLVGSSSTGDSTRENDVLCKENVMELGSCYPQLGHSQITTPLRIY